MYYNIPLQGLDIKIEDCSGTRHGHFKQLIIIGSVGRTVDKRGHNRGSLIYLVHCHICAQDSELFGNGYFTDVKHRIINNKYPCGCGRNPHYEEGQFKVLEARRAAERGVEFVDIAEPFHGSRTRCLYYCTTHSKRWESMRIDGQVGMCPQCVIESKRDLQRNDEAKINSFWGTGNFAEGTTFERNLGIFPMECWDFTCGDCGESVRGIHSSSLEKGIRHCYCDNYKDQNAYINIIYDGDIPVAAKFGISVKPRDRLARQNKTSKYKLENYGIWRFLDRRACFKSENDCFNTLECGILPKYDMPDGYTETTWIHNIDKIVNIYENNGGLHVQQ